MTLAFVAITTEPGREAEVYRALQGVGAVGDLQPLLGEFDLMAKVEAPDLEALGRAIVSEIRTIPGVVSTKTFATTGR